MDSRDVHRVPKDGAPIVVQILDHNGRAAFGDVTLGFAAWTPKKEDIFPTIRSPKYVVDFPGKSRIS